MDPADHKRRMVECDRALEAAAQAIIQARKAIEAAFDEAAAARGHLQDERESDRKRRGGVSD